LTASGWRPKHWQKQDTRTTIIRNPAGRTVVIALAADPDIRIQEEFNGQLPNKVAIEPVGRRSFAA
jgi:XcyI restriction endonuclease